MSQTDHLQTVATSQNLQIKTNCYP